MPKYLVTGAAGFIGSHLTNRLIAEGKEVIAVDDLSIGRWNNLGDGYNSCFRVTGQTDALRPKTPVFKGVKTVYHLAAMLQNDHQHLFRSNISGLYNVMVQARHTGAKRFIFTSSAAVYGNVDTLCTEELPYQPLTNYAQTKVWGEQIVRWLAPQVGLDYTILRLFNVYGPVQWWRFGAVVAQYAYLIKRGMYPKLHGDGLQQRDFVYIDDVVDVLRKVEPDPTTYGQTYNVGTGQPTIVKDLMYRLMDIQGTEDRSFVAQVARAGDIRYSVAGIRKIQDTLGWTPAIDLDTGLRRTLEAA